MKTVAQEVTGSPNPVERSTALVAVPAAPKAKGGISKFRTVTTFLRRGACSNTLMTVLDRTYGHPMDLEERATDPLAGGMMQGYQCGMLWGSTLAAGAQAHRLYGEGPQAEAAALGAAQKLVGSFRACHHHINCLEITETDPRNKWQVFLRFFVKGETVRCMGRAARYAPVALREIDSALEDAKPEGEGSPAPDAPARCDPARCDSASCATKLARMMGASEQHAVMAAGFAGGIGLCGGACGALGAAIWILGMQGRDEGLPNKVINVRINALIERFQKATDYELECSAIVGRTFEGLDDHARHVRDGGCAKILAVLAGTSHAPAELSAPTASAA